MAKPEGPTRGRIESALAEFDAIGQDAFLMKYEKGHAPDRWLLRVSGRFYPMKAVWVASHQPSADPSDVDYRNGIRDLRELGYVDIVAVDEKDHRPPLATPTLNSVLAAMQEFRLIGTEAFLRRYTEGYAPKSRYVRYQGENYPLKALFAASNVPAIRHRHFGYKHAEAEMKSLGFEVVVLRIAPEPLEPKKADDGVSEGLRIIRELNVIKRNRAIVERAKAAMIPLVCEACGFDFEKRYGAHGRGFIEAHHLEPLSDRQGVDKPTTPADFAMLCANCHRMVHYGGGCLTLDALKSLIRAHAEQG